MTENSINIRLNITNNELFIKASVCFNEKMPDISFILNNDFVIDGIFSRDTNIRWEKINEPEPEFRCVCQNIKIITASPADNFEMAYHGKINNCWYNAVTDDIAALSFYSAWYPQDLPFNGPYKDLVIFENSGNCFVVKGTYDKFKREWRYGGEGYDPFNIIIFKSGKMKSVRNKHMNIYYVDPHMEKIINKIEKIYMDVLRFYNGNLFPRRRLPVLDIACVSPALTVGGAYRRKDLLFITKIYEDVPALEHLLAHETAHEWCNGAETTTWEDWLNETTAEWASLLYALENSNGGLFNFILDQKLERMSKGDYPPVKTADGSRPNCVHDKGTVLFYKIYQQYGKDVLAKMLRGFAGLETKNTETYLKYTGNNICNGVSEAIRNGIK